MSGKKTKRERRLVRKQMQKRYNMIVLDFIERVESYKLADRLKFAFKIVFKRI